MIKQADLRRFCLLDKANYMVSGTLKDAFIGNSDSRPKKPRSPLYVSFFAAELSAHSSPSHSRVD